jgi:predicted metal-dependent hydrolase
MLKYSSQKRLKVAKQRIALQISQTRYTQQYRPQSDRSLTWIKKIAHAYLTNRATILIYRNAHPYELMKIHNK